MPTHRLLMLGATGGTGRHSAPKISLEKALRSELAT